MCLGAESIQHLCKSIIMENTKLTEENAVGTCKYYCVVVQAGSPCTFPCCNCPDAIAGMNGSELPDQSPGVPHSMRPG